MRLAMYSTVLSLGMSVKATIQSKSSTSAEEAMVSEGSDSRASAMPNGPAPSQSWNMSTI